LLGLLSTSKYALKTASKFRRVRTLDLWRLYFGSMPWKTYRTTFFYSGIRLLEKHWNKCILVAGDRVEK